ncbi:hypothetical protein SASPL_146628 [Salvia splendens]|uniref:Uncharacterized protein n=1 Tax=Salvia splendens TaxID=180675 RepID=A0A8X8WCZ0_SALSN|nr:hypothetical protein SASPL_146628 [Salvia splendens]
MSLLLRESQENYLQISPEIREKENKVRITIVSNNPEKIRDRLCCKGAKVIKGIEFVEPPKPEMPKQPEKPKEPEKPKVVVIEEPEKPDKNVTFVDPPNEPSHDG